MLGSAVSMGRWRREAKHVLTKHAAELAAMPFWVFSSGPVGDPEQEDDDDRWLEPRKLMHKAEELGVREHVVFGGKVTDDPHGFIEKSMAGGIPAEFQDRREWDEIRAWARSIAAQVAGEVPATRG